jgi:glycosyltransferase involved in cell wall biosynthesis
MRVVLVDLLCNSPFFCSAMTKALADAGVDAELASPRFHLEPAYLDDVPRSSWIHDLVVHARRPRLLRLAVRAIEGPLNFAGLLARIRAHRFEVVHVQWVPIEGRNSPFMRILRSWCDRAGTLLVFTAHNASPHDRAGAVADGFRRDLDAAHLVVTHTEHVARALSTEIGTNSPITVVPHGPLFTDQALPARAEAAARMGRPDTPTVLFQGLLRGYKGLDLLADAWPTVTEAVPAATLLVVGKVADQAVVDDLRRLVRPGVSIVDRYVTVPEMLDCYAVADLVVFPYRRISQSGALMTAAGLARPTVVTPIAGLLEQVAKLRSAVVADDVSADAVARAIVASLSRRRELAAEAERDREAIATSPLGWRAVAEATVRAYETRRDELGFKRHPS